MAVAVIVDEVLEQRDRLLGRLGDQRERLHTLWSWYRGQQDPPEVMAKYAQAYQLLLGDSVTPWARLVVDVVEERLRVQGFRAAEDPEAARLAWRGFVRSRMTADQRLVYVEALVGGTGYVSVARAGGGEPFVVPESAFEVCHEPNLSDRGVVAGALKLYRPDYARPLWVCELYRPDATYRWVMEYEKPPRNPDAFPVDNGARDIEDLAWLPAGEEPNPAGVVPIIPFENRLSPLQGGASEIEDCVPVLRRIDRLTLDQMLASAYSSFRMKWATGLQVPRDPDTGRPVEPFKAAVDRLWVNPSPDGRFGTFESSDITQYLRAVDSQIATLAAISRVPAHYLLQSQLSNPPSAESLIVSESGLTAKCAARQASYGEAWEQAFTLYADLSGHPVELDTLEVQWVDAERRNPAQIADAAVKMKAVDVPPEAIWAFWGFSPQQIEEFSQEQAAMELLAAATQQAALAVAPEVPPVAAG